MRPSKPENEDEDPAAALKRLRLTALRALTRKEHGAMELQRKLEQKGFPSGQVSQVLAVLRQEGLLDDNRYAESFVRQHVLRGQGPARIRAELRIHGLSAEAVHEALSGADVNWTQLAREVRRKRFGAAPPRTGAERAKQGRFLQYRGFDSDQIRAAFRGVSDSDEAADRADEQDEACDPRDLEA
ncbi:MAG TPA: regulatory protein RecX [Steroidobacteraceae bacterium]|nr:regulatory protein RecX [Steroidobacteraceae bacterium]